MNKTFEDLKKDQIGLLHRQWVWADYIRIMYEAAFRNTPREVLLNPMKFYVNQAGCYMCLWYSLIFSVLERLKEWKIVFPEIESEIKDIYSPLKLFRNAVFHPPRRYWDTRLFNLFRTRDAGSKIRTIHKFIGDKFLEAMT